MMKVSSIEGEALFEDFLKTTFTVIAFVQDMALLKLLFSITKTFYS